MTTLTASHKDRPMTEQTPLPLRNDTILGVCEAIGRDFGFNPTYLRLAFIAPLFFAPMATIAVYLALGVIITLSRLAAPDQAVAAPQLVSSHEIAKSDAKSEEALAIAA